MADTFWVGVSSLLNDTITEYPIETEKITDWDYEKWGILPKLLGDSKLNNSIFVLERFNVYPELILAGVYRILNSLELLHSDCFQISIDGVILSLLLIFLNLNIVLFIALINIITLTGNGKCTTTFNLGEIPKHV